MKSEHGHNTRPSPPWPTPIPEPPHTHLSTALEPHGCILAIVGSTSFANSATPLRKWQEAQQKVFDAIARHGPRLVISGGAEGVDRMAEMACVSQVPFQPIEPLRRKWDGIGGYKDRNKKIARGCECLVSIRDVASTTYGSGWTADYAEKLGKKVERETVA